VKGRRPGQGTGFEIDESDLSAMENCYGIVVASAIFGIIFLYFMWKLNMYSYNTTHLVNWKYL
jgi:Protein of unknown function (DUF616)